MNRLIKAKRGLHGGIKGTKFSAFRSAGKGSLTAQKVARGSRPHKLAGNDSSSKRK